MIIPILTQIDHLYCKFKYNNHTMSFSKGRLASMACNFFSRGKKHAFVKMEIILFPREKDLIWPCTFRENIIFSWQDQDFCFRNALLLGWDDRPTKDRNNHR